MGKISHKPLDKAAKRVDQHQYFTARPKVWRAIRKANIISPRFASKVNSINLYNRLAGVGGWLQRSLYDRRIKAVSLEENPPLFILGHWRNGTTHLHYMLAEDPRLGYLSNYQCLFFNNAFLTRSWLKPLVSLFFPKTRPMDNMSFSPEKPGEEEQPLSSISTRSGIHSLFFPKNRYYLDKYNFFKDISQKELDAWKKDFLYVVKAISYYNDEKPLVLKNPHHTGRVKALLEVFPNSKFVLPHRDPYEVYRSTVHLYNTIIRDQMLQEFSDQEIEDAVIYLFKNTMGNYLKYRDLIPKGNLIEISFQELADRPIETVTRVYKELSLPGFSAAKPRFEAYLDSVKSYQRNRFTELAPLLIERINREWNFYFEAFGYEKR